MNHSVKEEDRLKSLHFGQEHAPPAVQIQHYSIWRFAAGPSFVAVSAGESWKSDHRGTRYE